MIVPVKHQHRRLLEDLRKWGSVWTSLTNE